MLKVSLVLAFIAWYFVFSVPIFAQDEKPKALLTLEEIAQLPTDERKACLTKLSDDFLIQIAKGDLDEGIRSAALSYIKDKAMLEILYKNEAVALETRRLAYAYKHSDWMQDLVLYKITCVDTRYSINNNKCSVLIQNLNKVVGYEKIEYKANMFDSNNSPIQQIDFLAGTIEPKTKREFSVNIPGDLKVVELDISFEEGKNSEEGKNLKAVYNGAKMQLLTATPVLPAKFDLQKALAKDSK